MLLFVSTSLCNILVANYWALIIGEIIKKKRGTIENAPRNESAGHQSKRCYAMNCYFPETVKVMTEDHSPARDRAKGSVPTERPGEPE